MTCPPRPPGWWGAPEVSGSQENPTTASPARLDALIKDAESKLARQSQVVRDAPDPVARQREWIARVIIWVFAGAIILGLAVLLPEGLLASKDAQAQAWKDVATQSADLIKSAVLPVVTLVLGYYFGQASRA